MGRFYKAMLKDGMRPAAEIAIGEQRTAVAASTRHLRQHL